MDVVMFLAEIKEVVVTLAAATGAFVAYQGLNKWKAELRGRVLFEAAHDFLEKMYKVRASIHSVRSNLISAVEFPETKDLSERERYTHVFKNRWAALDSALADMDSVIFKGQALWGKDFESHLKPLYELVHELNSATNKYLEYLSDDPNEDSDHQIEEDLIEVKRIVFHVPILDRRHNSFGDKLFRILRDIDNEVRNAIETQNGC